MSEIAKAISEHAQKPPDAVNDSNMPPAYG